ncbi:hypothetical protein JTE90_009026 [Oedothorax gibbosus]|uniref:Uncharacterized protein n=1 Tax=Oedothorax gibbosus TaxID=931172 RepID=A0AAV6VLE7_9ARAC|nr:hypothetical protein JTE90_009026 [Oedothorax gibbosus]
MSSQDNRLLLLPWVATISTATGLELAAALYFVTDAIEHPWIWILFATDILFCLLSVYCVMCVVSQYQNYLARMGRNYNQPIPTVRFQASDGSGPGVSTVSQQMARRQNGLLAPPTNNSSSSNKSHTDTSSFSADDCSATTT